MLIKNSGARKGWWPGPWLAWGHRPPQSLHFPPPIPNPTWQNSLEMRIQSDTDSHWCRRTSNILWHLPHCPPPRPERDQGGALSPGSPCSEDLKEILPQSIQNQGGPEKEPVPQGGAQGGRGYPWPPLLPLGFALGFILMGARAQPRGPASPLLEKEEGAAPKAHSPSNPISRLASPQFPSQWGPHSKGKTPVTHSLANLSVLFRPHPPATSQRPVLGSSSSLCSWAG